MAPRRKNQARYGLQTPATNNHDYAASKTTLTDNEMIWEPNERAEFFINSGRLEYVVPNLEHARLLISQARLDVESAKTISSTGGNFSGALTLAYDGARKALNAILADQGYRPTIQGGHTVIADYLRPQFPNYRTVFDKFDKIRAIRNNSEYPAPNEPVATLNDVSEAIPLAQTIIEIASKYLTKYGEK